MVQGLTLLQKRKIVLEHNECSTHVENASQRAIDEWTQRVFKLTTQPSNAAMSRIFSGAVALRPLSLTSTIAKNICEKKGKHQKIEQALFEWVCTQQARQVSLNGPMICEKALRIQTMVNEEQSMDQKTSIKFSEGWLDNSKRRWRLRVFKLHGEAGDVDQDVVESELPRVKELMKSFSLRDIFDADECGLFRQMASDSTIVQKRIPGRKKARARLTLLACANANSSEMIELMVIETAFRLRA